MQPLLMLLTKATAGVNPLRPNPRVCNMKGDYPTCLTHPKTGKVNCRQPEILIDGGQLVASIGNVKSLPTKCLSSGKILSTTTG